MGGDFFCFSKNFLFPNSIYNDVNVYFSHTLTVLR
jgi:hypothetical protein